MKVFSRTIRGNSFCLVKILNALKKYAPPNVVFVDNYQDADLVLLHINGRHDHFQRFIDVCKKPYVAINTASEAPEKRKRPSGDQSGITPRWCGVIMNLINI